MSGVVISGDKNGNDFYDSVVKYVVKWKLTIIHTVRIMETITLAFHFTACIGAKADIVIVLDASTSVTELNFQLQLAFVQDLMKPADIDNGNVRVGLLTYSTDVYTQFYLNEYNSKSAIINAIGNVPYNYGSTNTADAMKSMRTEMFSTARGDRPDVDNIAVVMTDGVSNINSRRTIPEGKLARDAGITVFAIGIGIQDTRELDGIASRPLDEYRFNVEDFEALQDIGWQLYSSICSREYLEI